MIKTECDALSPKQTASAAVANDKLAMFLQQHIGAVTDMYLLNLAELTRYKERHYQQQLTVAQNNEAKLSLKVGELEQKLHQALAPNIVTQVEPTEKLTVEASFNGWQKIGIDGNELAVDEPNWAAAIDEKTKLMWAINSNPKGNFPNPNKRRSFSEAQKWVKKVNEEGWCGYFDWRLPMIDELKNLLLSHESDNQLFIKNDVFFDIVNTKYVVWSSSEIEHNYNCVLIVNFQNKSSFPFTKYGNNYVRLVRSVEV